MATALENDVCIEIHTNSLENPIEKYNTECESGEIIRIYKSLDEEIEENIYQPIVKIDGTKKNIGFVKGLKRENKMNVCVHTNQDIKVLWNIKNDFDITKDICSCVIDCDIVDIWNDKFEEVKLFIDENKKRPNTNSPNTTSKNMNEKI